MIDKTLEIKGDCDEFKLTIRYDTEPFESDNWECMKAAGKGFIRDERGKLQGRLILRIPLEDAQMLRTNYDLDWLAFENNNDKAAMKRLLARFPYWRAAEGGI